MGVDSAEIIQPLQDHITDQTLRRLLSLLHESKSQGLLTAARMILSLFLNHLYIRHKTRDILIEQRHQHQILHGHLILRVMDKQLSTYLIQFNFTE